MTLEPDNRGALAGQSVTAIKLRFEVLAGARKRGDSTAERSAPTAG